MHDRVSARRAPITRTVFRIVSQDCVRRFNFRLKKENTRGEKEGEEKKGKVELTSNKRKREKKTYTL